jgi:hypothetical protein
MKMVMITYNESVDDEVMDILKEAGVSSYTKIMRAFGKGSSSGTHLGDDIWPGMNNIFYISCRESEAQKIIEGVKALRREIRHLGIKAFMWELDEIRWEE